MPCQALFVKIFCFSEMKISSISTPSCSTEGRLEIVIDAGRDAMDAAVLARDVMAGRVERSVSR